MASESINPLLRLRVFVEAHGTQAAAARVLGCSRSFVNRMLQQEDPIPASVLDKLGLKQIVVNK